MVRFRNRIAAIVLLVPLVFTTTVRADASITMQWRFSVDTLHVTCQYPSVPDSTVTISLSEWAGVPDYHRFVRNVSVFDSSVVLSGAAQLDSNNVTVAPKGRPFTVSYSVVSEKETFSGEGRNACFHPTIFSEWAYLWGYSFLLLPDNVAWDSLPLTLSIDPGPYRVARTSLDTTALTLRDLRQSLTIAGDFRRYDTNIAGAPVEFHIRGEYAFSDEEFREAVVRIFSAQAEYIGNYPPDRRMVVLVEGSAQSSGGTVISKAVALYPDPVKALAADGAPTLRLISHEHFHVLGHQIGIDTTRPEGYYKWFQEGLTEYYAYLTLYREGLYTGKDFIDALNKLTVKYVCNPNALTATADTLAVRYWASRDLNELPYNKGAMIGFLIDLRIRMTLEDKLSIDQFMRALAAKDGGYSNGGPTVDDMQAALDSLTGRTWKDDFDGWILGAGPLPLCEIAREAGLSCAPEPVTVFDLGIKTESGELRKGDTIVEVASHAAQAGIHVGDTLVGWSIYGNRTDKPATLKIRRDGSDRDATFLPVAKREIVQLGADPATLQALERLRRR